MIMKIFLIFILLMVLKPILISVIDFRNLVRPKLKAEDMVQKPQVLSYAMPRGLVISIPSPKAEIKSYNPSEKESSDNFVDFTSSGSPVVIEYSGTSISIRIFPSII